MSLAIRDARVVVALDFGTAFSGFAYAHKTSPDNVFKFYEWADCNKGGGRPYCKTHTGLYYVRAEDGGSDVWELKDWGWSALVSYIDAVQLTARAHRQQELRRKRNLPSDHPPVADGPEVGVHASKFKLHLAGEGNEARSVLGLVTADSLPLGLTAERCITDYLAKMSSFIFDQLQQKFGSHLTKRDVQWCLTVPAIWDDGAKGKMRMCAEKAGIVSGPCTPRDAVSSAHPLVIILEPEAAAFYCWSKFQHLDLERKDQFLIADVGGGTTDLVVHAKASDGRQLKLKEVAASSGGVCGGANVDQNFINFLRQEIGCFDDFMKENVSVLLELQRKWQAIKCNFDGDRPDLVFDVDLPARLAREWEEHDESECAEPRSAGYDELVLTTGDVKSIFDPVVDEIISLIGAKMSEEVKVLMVVGGFSSSAYLMKRIREAFCHRVQEIINPPEPGSAICHGALLMGLASTDCIVSRVARKTYGTGVARTFNSLIDPPDLLKVVNGKGYCMEAFVAYLHKGSEVETDECVHHFCYPTFCGQETVDISVFSCSTDAVPLYTTDAGVVLEGTFTMDISDEMELDMDRAIEVSMFFGKSTIEVRARRDNFGDTSNVETLPMLVSLF